MLLISLQISNVICQENNFEKHLINKRWILNEEHNSGSYDDLVSLQFIPFDSPSKEKLPRHLRYAGLTFKENGVLIEHVWNKCGTGNPPNYYEAKWSIKPDSEDKILTISKSRKWDGKYLVQSITLESFNLKRVK